jgi:hypothetical protein
MTYGHDAITSAKQTRSPKMGSALLMPTGSSQLPNFQKQARLPSARRRFSAARFAFSWSISQIM